MVPTDLDAALLSPGGGAVELPDGVVGVGVVGVVVFVLFEPGLMTLSGSRSVTESIGSYSNVVLNAGKSQSTSKIPGNAVTRTLTSYVTFPSITATVGATRLAVSCAKIIAAVLFIPDTDRMSVNGAEMLKIGAEVVYGTPVVLLPPLLLVGDDVVKLNGEEVVKLDGNVVVTLKGDEVVLLIGAVELEGDDVVWFPGLEVVPLNGDVVVPFNGAVVVPFNGAVVVVFNGAVVVVLNGADVVPFSGVVVVLVSGVVVMVGLVVVVLLNDVVVVEIGGLVVEFVAFCGGAGGAPTKSAHDCN